jgi:hypothetical protein
MASDARDAGDGGGVKGIGYEWTGADTNDGKTQRGEAATKKPRSTRRARRARRKDDAPSTDDDDEVNWPRKTLRTRKWVRPSFVAVNGGIGVSANGGPQAAVSGIKMLVPWAHRPWAEHRREADATKEGHTHESRDLKILLRCEDLAR